MSANGLIGAAQTSANAVDTRFTQASGAATSVTDNTTPGGILTAGVTVNARLGAAGAATSLTTNLGSKGSRILQDAGSSQ